MRDTVRCGGGSSGVSLSLSAPQHVSQGLSGHVAGFVPGDGGTAARHTEFIHAQRGSRQSSRQEGHLPHTRTHTVEDWSRREQATISIYKERRLASWGCAGFLNSEPRIRKRGSNRLGVLLTETVGALRERCSTIPATKGRLTSDPPFELRSAECESSDYETIALKLSKTSSEAPRSLQSKSGSILSPDRVDEDSRCEARLRIREFGFLLERSTCVAVDAHFLQSFSP